MTITMIMAAAADGAHHVSNMLPFKIALIGILGIGAQWLAWKLQRPAIVLMAIAGLIFGPLISWLLMVLLASPIAWLLGTCAAHYIVGLAWDISAMVGGLFVVTGPTVIMPLLRQAHLKSRPANVLKWEGIVNDPLGALFAVGGYEFIRFSQTEASMYLVFGKLTFAALFGTVMGIISGYGLAWSFRKGHIPEYLKAPILLAWILAIFVMANTMAAETGLLAVTALGMTMANTKFASMVELHRFKENIAIILVSGVFVILTATLTPEILVEMVKEWRVAAFVLTMMIFVRPIAVMLSTLWSGLNWKESLLISFIAPRGVVAVAVAGLFAAELTAIGRTDGALFVPLAFALVFATVLFAGFFIGPLSKALGLASGGGDGVMIVGANPWSLGLAKALKEMDVKVLVSTEKFCQKMPITAWIIRPLITLSRPHQMTLITHLSVLNLPQNWAVTASSKSRQAIMMRKMPIPSPLRLADGRSPLAAVALTL